VKSRLLTRVEVDPARVEEDVRALDLCAVPPDYSEYTFGHWQSYVLANGSGDDKDARFRPYSGTAHLTELGRQMPYVVLLIEAHFHWRTLKWARIFTMEDALLVTHRDFLEFEEPLHRIHLVLRTDETCLHSEGETVFHMRRGEVWQVDGLSLHAACTLSSYRRISLVLDFEQDGTAAASRLRAAPAEPPPAPCLVELPPLAEAELAALPG
jgi:hypothetical protein